MPVLEVSALAQPVGTDIVAVSAALSESVAAVLDEAPSATWVIWRTVEPGSYAEHGDAPDVQPRATHPPFVRVTAYEGRAPLVVKAVLLAVAETLERELGMEPGNVMVRWDEVGAGRLYTGGTVVGA